MWQLSSKQIFPVAFHSVTVTQVCYSPVTLAPSDSWKHTAPMTGWPAWHTPYRDSNSIMKFCRLDIVNQLATQFTGWQLTTRLDKSHTANYRQVAQLSQRDRTAGWVSYNQKWKTGTGSQYFTANGHYESIFNHCDVTVQQSNRIWWRNTRYQSKAHMWLPISD